MFFDLTAEPADVQDASVAVIMLEGCHERAIWFSPVFLGCFCFFLQADIRETGTLTEHELSEAMRSVMGVTPNAAETTRVLRFFGERGSEGEFCCGERRVAMAVAM